MQQRAPVSRMVIPVQQLTPYLRVRIATSDRSLVIEHRRALLCLIPLWTHRIEITFAELSSARVKTNVRLQCLAAAALLLASIFLFDLSLGVRVALGVVGLIELMMALAPLKALRIERIDGRGWTIPFCWRYAFDAELALMDARERRDAGSETRPSAGEMHVPRIGGTL